MTPQFLRIAALSLLLHLGFLFYGFVQDQHPVVKFTDVDYLVFTDGARFVAEGKSPYQRATYRYTPALAFLVLPNVLVHNLWGKLLFSVCDLAAGWFTHSILRMQGMNADRAAKYSAIWLLNPFVVAISTRGNAESIVAVLTLGTLWTLLAKRPRLSAVLLGVSVHFKLYPIIYALPIWLFLDESYFGGIRNGMAPGTLLQRAKRFFSWRRIEYGCLSGMVFLGLSGCMFSIYGDEFVEETYLYHITRKDHRHNFSAYFYHMYLSSAPSKVASSATLPPWVASILSFLPQLGLVSLLGTFLAKDVVFACFAQTFAFVMLNKVCTSQYFMWYLCFLPVILPNSRLLADKWKQGVALLLTWVGGQALWLSQAYRLEHLGENTFRKLWAAGLGFYLINAVLLSTLISSHTYEPLLVNGSIKPAFGRGGVSHTSVKDSRKARPIVRPSSSRAVKEDEKEEPAIVEKLELVEKKLGEGATQFVVQRKAAGSSIGGMFALFGIAVGIGIMMHRMLDCSIPLCALPFAILLAAHLSAVRQESITFIGSLGVSLQTTYSLGRTKSRFIPLDRIADVIINEGITMLTVRYYMAVMVKGEREMIVVFEVGCLPGA
ncbi:PIG-M-domain-containing protein [Fimicolochytrium jonesii]|uniref:PIG-M-domain-containing protein n=1 Tax=Fimicolochytrium jonesii TaxID=1396493 RepID=UPI0022FE542A|nr:PIG-M-domain-containing protein [Fimicolochytrium jonesii]KAI8818750.1 PIG-M-domain-containing protein [Fimicolochytrium jonesii]